MRALDVDHKKDALVLASIDVFASIGATSLSPASWELLAWRPRSCCVRKRLLTLGKSSVLNEVSSFDLSTCFGASCGTLLLSSLQELRRASSQRSPPPRLFPSEQCLNKDSHPKDPRLQESESMFLGLCVSVCLYIHLSRYPSIATGTGSKCTTCGGMCVRAWNSVVVAFPADPSCQTTSVS